MKNDFDFFFCHIVLHTATVVIISDEAFRCLFPPFSSQQLNVAKKVTVTANTANLIDIYFMFVKYNNKCNSLLKNKE